MVEADESDASFLYLQPSLAVVTNIDADHMQTYDHSVEKLRQAFVDFLQRLPFYGVAVLCIDDPGVREIAPVIAKTVVTYGLAPEAQVRAVDFEARGGRMSFRAVCAANGSPAMELPVTLNLPGVHNVQNALAAIAVGLELGVRPEKIVDRACRVQRRGTPLSAVRRGRAWKAAAHSTLIDDYGHHPVEMAATLAAARGAFPGRRLVLAFQPHRYTRTRDCFEDFVKVLSTVDVLVLTEVYAAGEAPIVAADGQGACAGRTRAGQGRAALRRTGGRSARRDSNCGARWRRGAHDGRGLDRRRARDAREESRRRSGHCDECRVMIGEAVIENASSRAGGPWPLLGVPAPASR